MFSGTKYVLRTHMQFVHSKHIIRHELHDTMTKIVVVADETVKRTMAITVFRHQSTPVVPLRICHYVSPVYLCLYSYELHQDAAYLPFPSGR
jgi:hypothetical protein